MKKLLVYPCGTRVQINDANECGIIVGIIIRDTKIIYEIAYYYNGNYCIHQFNECQLSFKKVDKMQIGFKKINPTKKEGEKQY